MWDNHPSVVMNPAPEEKNENDQLPILLPSVINKPALDPTPSIVESNDPSTITEGSPEGARDDHRVLSKVIQVLLKA